MNRLFLSGAALLLLALTACPSSPKRAAPAAPPAAAPPAALANAPGTSCDAYQGRLPGPADVTLYLTRTSSRAADGELGGIYATYYGADGEPHELEAARAAPDSLVLTEYLLGANQATGAAPEARLSWRLRWTPGGDLTGTYAGQPLLLRPVPPAVRLVVRSFADSVAAYPGKANSPYGRLGLQTLVPAAGLSAGVQQELAANILRQQRGDTLPARPVPAGLAGVWQQHRQRFAQEYRESVADLAPDPADSTATPGYMLRFADEQNAYVLCQQGALLSLGFLSYSYTGGAHGNYGTQVCSFDLRSGRALAFADIFRPDAGARLLPLLERGVRRRLGIAPGERLDTELFDNEIKLTKNVCLTPGGALFVYMPYEIASYATGEIKVFVPLVELRPLLRQGLPLPAGPAL